MIKNTAIILAGGNGSRMNSDIPKQYMDIYGRPVLFYSIYEMEKCDFITDIILVTRQEDIEYCQKEIVDKYGFTKVSKITAGGTERFFSVYNGLKCVSESSYVWIHDGARPCINIDMLCRLRDSVAEYDAVVAAVPSKDTVKLAGDNQMVESTPDRGKVWNVQTPQVFNTKMLLDAYDKMFHSPKSVNITDDAMVMEQYGSIPVRLEMGDYTNIKITTPEDISAVKNYLKKFEK